MVKVLMKLDLSGLLESQLNLRRLVVFLNILSLILVHSMLDLIMLRFGVICIVLLLIILLQVLSMHAMLNMIHPILQLGGASAYYELEDTYDKVHNLVEIPLEGCCEVYVHEESSSLGFNYVSPSPFNYSYVCSMCSPTFSIPSIILMCPLIILSYMILI